MSDERGPQPRDGRRRWRRVRWAIRGLVLLGAMGYLKFVGLDGKFYYPDSKVYTRPEELGLKYEPVTFRTRDGVTLSGWFLPAEGPAKGFVVHCHGNAGNITNHVVLTSWLPAAGYHVLMFDYRGYGQSEGRVTRAGTITDAHAALDYALSRPEARGLPLFLYGQSLGGAVAVVVAAARPEVVAVVAESTFGSYRGIAARHLARLVHSEWLSRALVKVAISAGNDPLDVVERVAPRPLFVISAAEDQICYPELGRELYEAAREPKSWWLVPGAGHLDILETHSEALARRIGEFLAQAARGN